ncbi:hypothetical protein [Qipengyuania flava]|uniref:hypothetical protein n=1 Tax=Qipengyuania flava TaxID=192812 RepID=UPI00141BD4AE|nr:hypothetical protein [Qipengyuania flava]NIJ62701.1 hypothetical protein [Qipengyuania flava]
MNPNELIIRYEMVDRQTEGAVTRLVGLVRARNLLSLFDAADLEANPRSAKVGAVTADIIESIERTPELFPFKTKGILIAASVCRSLERNRYQLVFENIKIEGILDGGHNTLSIGLYVLKQVMEDVRAWKRIKNWPAFKEAWAEHRDEVAALKKAHHSGDGGPLDFLVPVEILVPADAEDDFVLNAFTGSLLEIGAARNNNVQLTLETKANKKGFYDELRNALPSEIAKRVEWKANDGGVVKVRDLVALSWIPLSVVDLPDGVNVPAPSRIYASKGECTKAFDALMSDPAISKPTGGEYTHELHNVAVGSALKVAAQLPELYDLIYLDFPAAYNDNGAGRFGRLTSVKMASDMRSKPTSPFTQKLVQYSYPDGFIMPLVYGLKALMMTDDQGNVVWKVKDPAQFIHDNLTTIVRKYRVIIEAYSGDPQKIGKNEGSYSLALDAFETELLRLAQPA